MLPVKRLAVIGFELAVSKKSTGSAGKASRAGRPPGRDRRRAGPPPKSGARAGGLQPTGEFERGDRQNTPISLGRHRPSTSIIAVLKSAKSPFCGPKARLQPPLLPQPMTAAGSNMLENTSADKSQQRTTILSAVECRVPASFGPSQGTEEPTRYNTRVKLLTGGLLACCGWPSHWRGALPQCCQDWGRFGGLPGTGGHDRTAGT